MESDSALLLKSLAVEALAMAMARLPGQASPALASEQSTPARSTTADHMRLGLKMPPLFICTTICSSRCTLMTTDCGRAHWLR